MLSKATNLIAAAAFLLAWPAAAQFTPTAHDARSAAVGGCLLPKSGRQVSIGYRSQFLLAAMAERQVALALPLGSGSLGAEYWHRGNSDYHEQRLQAGYGLRVASWLCAEVGMAYLHYGTADPFYPSHSFLAASALLQADLGRDATLMLGIGSRPWDSGRPARGLIQLAYRPQAGWLTIVQAESEERWRLRAGAEYEYRGQLAVRAGMATAPLALTFGVGLRMGAWRIDLAAEAHSRLGLSPHTSLTLCF